MSSDIKKDLMEGAVYAQVFGLQNFPVCSPDQKAEIERAFNSALEFMDQPHEETTGCVCDIIIQLLAGTADRDTQARAAKIVTEAIYRDKMALLNMMEGLIQSDVSPSKAAH